ncbi:hypothetical protein RHMOL_Rhmol02G0144300 [Rhododendron molle]|uniref:Uncharacterized protein n=1 Tax=Rhododendron molle TaxID=49168 RepID=A0ACC0PSS2_RHOML|nr:hypothetical protein RHMOL_Rhmol02G0144300 [Rhododendron molle]
MNSYTQNHISLRTIEKLSAPENYNINLKACNYDFGDIRQCKFTVRSIYLATPKQPLKKARKELFRMDSLSTSTALEDTHMQLTPQEEHQTLGSKKRPMVMNNKKAQYQTNYSAFGNEE